MKNEIQIMQVPEGTDVQFNAYGAHAKQIANAPGGIIEFISLDATDKLPVDRVRFDCSCYNLFVVNEPIKTNGSFTVHEDEWLKNSADMIPNGLTKECLDRFAYFPSIIVRVNDYFRTATQGEKAALAVVFNPEVGSDAASIKFHYIIIHLFPAQILNEKENEFGILSSGQSNELDELCWEIKNKNVLHLLGLKGGENGKE